MVLDFISLRVVGQMIEIVDLLYFSASPHAATCIVVTFSLRLTASNLLSAKRYQATSQAFALAKLGSHVA